jgi:hypothetical protein
MTLTWIQTAYESLQEWQLLYQDQYISEILDLEKPPADLLCLECRSQQGSFRCKECFSQSLLCQSCCFVVHRNMPLHHIKKWTGQFFNATSLNQEGFILYLATMENPVQRFIMGGVERRSMLRAQMRMVGRVKVGVKVRECHSLDGRRKMGGVWLLLTLQESTNFALAGADVKLQLSLTSNC